MKKTFKGRRIKKGGKGGSRASKGAPKGEYLNDKYYLDIPYIKEHLDELNEDEINKLKNNYNENFEKAEADFDEATVNYKIDKEDKKQVVKQDKTHRTAIELANMTSRDAADFRNFLTFSGIMIFISTSSKETIAETIKILGEILPLIIKILNQDILIKIIIPMVIIIGTLMFIMYLLGFKINAGEAPATPATGSFPADTASSKPEYTNSETLYDKFMNLLMSIPGLKNILANYKVLNTNLKKNLGGVDILEQYTIDRNKTIDGRNDNIYNIKLAKYFSKTDDQAYSIIKPAELEIKYDDVKDKLTDLNNLPLSIQDEILKDKKVIKLKWDIENDTKFKLKCNNIKDEADNDVIIYKDCSSVKKNENKEYITRERNKNNVNLDAFE